MYSNSHAMNLIQQPRGQTSQSHDSVRGVFLRVPKGGGQQFQAVALRGDPPEQNVSQDQHFLGISHFSLVSNTQREATLFQSRSQG